LKTAAKILAQFHVGMCLSWFHYSPRRRVHFSQTGGVAACWFWLLSETVYYSCKWLCKNEVVSCVCRLWLQGRQGVHITWLWHVWRQRRWRSI